MKKLRKSADTLADVVKDLQNSYVPSNTSAGKEAAPEATSTTDNGAAPDHSTSVEVMSANGKYIQIPVDLLDDSESQYRMIYPESEMQSLVQTLQNGGQVEPIRVRKKANGRYELIAGHRRKRAAILAGLLFLNAIVVEITDREAALQILLSNESHEQTGDFERATAYRKLHEDIGVNATEISNQLGISKSLISMRMAFFNLPVEVLDALKEYPRAYSHNTVAVLLKILRETPSLLPDVAEGTRKVGAGDWTPSTLISTLRKRQGSPVTSKTDDGVLAIVDGMNKPVLTITPKANPKNIEISLAPDIDPEAFIQKLSALLRDEAAGPGMIGLRSAKSETSA